jgi:hypothetical protein
MWDAARENATGMTLGSKLRGVAVINSNGCNS